jgi:hypothetical protein
MIYVMRPPVNVLTVVKLDYLGTIVTNVSLLIVTDQLSSDSIMIDSKSELGIKMIVNIRYLKL